MTKPVTIPNTFATATTAIPLSQLDSDFSTVATALNDANTYSNYAADTGVVNAYVVTLTGVSTTYSAGLRIQFKAGNANTGASTLNVNGGGTKNITFQDASALSSGTIAANAIVDVMYDGTQFLLMNDPAGTVGTGDVVGPAGATANAAAIFDSTTGKLIKDSKVIITPVANSSTLTIANNKTVTVNNTLTLSGTDSTTMTFPSTSATIARTDSAQTFTGVQTFSSNPVLSGGTANGVLYLNGSNVATSGSALTFDGTTFQYTGPANFATSSGNVGIGTSSPIVKLQVNDTSEVAIAISTGGTRRGAFYADGSLTVINAYQGNPLIFSVASSGISYSEKARIDSSGNLGLGVTPSAWGSGMKAFQNASGSLASVSTAEHDWTQNAYNNGTNYIYVNTAAATVLRQTAGQFRFYNAPSGTANTTTITSGVSYTIITSGNQTSFGAANNNVGTVFTATSSGTLSSGTVSQNITFTQAMTLDASGNLGIGTTSPRNVSGYKNLCIDGSTSGLFEIYTNGTRVLSVYGAANDISLVNPTATGTMQFYTNNTERARITSGGTFLIGNGETAASPSAGILSATGGTGTNIAGANLTIRGGASTGTGAGGVIIFSTAAASGTSGTATNSASERARITSGGDLLVATTDNAQSSGIGVKLRSIGATYVVNDGSADALSYYNTSAAAYRFYVDPTGKIYATFTTIGGISDQRLKENVQDLDVGLDSIMALKPRKFDWKVGKGKDIKGDRGFIAQEFEQVFPDLIDEWKDPAPEGEEPYKSVRQDLIPVLVKAIQEQQALITSLTARVALLEGTQP